MTIEEIHKLFISSKGVETDTRKDLNGKMFFALKGENFNGNRYALDALKKGAICAIVDEDIEEKSNKIIKVEDALVALQKLARLRIVSMECIVLAITGSNGKTTTKELLKSVLSRKYNTFSTYGNLNNHIGVPLTILAAPVETDFLIVEMGANHKDEITELCNIAIPDYGIITNVGEAHLEGFGSPEGVKLGKRELYDFIHLHGGVIFVNKNENSLIEMSTHVNYRVFYGLSTRNQPSLFFTHVEKYQPYIQGRIYENRISSIPFSSVLFGEYNARNISTAIAVGQYFGVSAYDIKVGIETYEPDNNRSQKIQLHSNLVILDAYNANPTSMKLALNAFLANDGEEKIVILGAMKELGKYSRKAHEDIQRILMENVNKLEQIILVGEEYRGVAHEKILLVGDVYELVKEFSLTELNDKHVLIKGSRSNRLELLIDGDKTH